MIMNTILKKAALAAAIASAPFAANAADLFGGGASLPAIAYVGDSFTNFDPQARFSTTDTTLLPMGMDSSAGVEAVNSIFSAYKASTTNNASYCQTGSGTGKRVLLGAANNGGTWSAAGNCGDYDDTPEGFSAPSGQVIPDFAGSDAPLTTADITTFTGGPRQSARTSLTQVPALGAFIALPLNVSTADNKPPLTTNQVCGIFAGVYQNWNQIDPDLGNHAINVVYREDGSGTVFAFTQYLAANCNGETIGNVTLPGNFFNTEEEFENALPVAPASMYAASTPASGNGGIIDAVNANEWSIGFANYSNVAAESGMNYARIRIGNVDHDPASGGAIIVADADILIDQVLGANGGNGLPTPQPVTGLTVDNCLAVVNPAIQLEQSYPIVAFTNLLTYTNNNPNATAVEGLFTAVSNASGLPAGYAALSSNKIDNVINTCIN